MQIAIALFDDFTALDAVGPYEVLSRLPDAQVVFCSFQRGVVRTDMGSLGIEVDATLDEVASPDIVVVPGGPGTRPLMSDDRMLDWIRRVHAGSTWTTSVCTGSLLLGAAGLLDGLEATGHWAAMDVLASTGAVPSPRRVVVDTPHRIVTAAGVSSGIDMALTLAGLVAGDDFGKAIQLGIEYDPQPPYDAGSPDKAPPALVELVRAAAPKMN
ncbi:MAG: DJ-1/PfpI family protein [Acidimicrobiales bacterium]